MASSSIVLVPLDVRPCCRKFPLRIGLLTDYEIVAPPEEYYPNFLAAGNVMGLQHWLNDVADKAQAFVLSADMMAYGGLAASSQDRVSVEEALDRLNVLRSLRADYPDKEIYVSGTITRTSIPAHSKRDAEISNLISRHSQLDYRVKHLGKAEDAEALRQVESQIPPEYLHEYLAVRERNHAVNRALVKWTEEGIIDFLVLAQCDTSPHGPHRNEQKILLTDIYDRQVPDRVVIYPGADEVNQVLLARAMQQGEGKQIRIYPRYSSVNGPQIVSDFEDIPLGEAVKLQVFALGGICVDTPEEADVILFVNTPAVQPDVDNFFLDNLKEGKVYKDIKHNLWDFISGMDHYLKMGRRVAVADVAFANGCDKWLVRYMKKSIDLSRLTAFAGWNTAGNTIGTVLSHATARWLYESRGAKCPACERIHLEFLMERFLDDCFYQSVVRTEVNDHFQQVTDMDIYRLGPYQEEVNQMVVDRLRYYAIPFFNGHFQGVERDGMGMVQGLEKLNIRLPGPRTFEVDVECEFDVRE